MIKSTAQIENEIRQALALCELAAVGLWTHMRYVIDDSDRPGTLRQNGRPLSVLQLARVAGCDASTVAPMLQHLVEAGLIEQQDDGYISRPLARIREIRQKGAARVKKHRAEGRALRNVPCNADVTQMKQVTGSPPVSLSPTPPISLNPLSPGEVSPDPSRPLTAATPAKRGKNRAKPEPIRTEAFTKFWDAWPKSERKADSRECADFWNRTGLEHVAEQVMAGLEIWKRSSKWTKNGGEFIEAPLVWLHKFRWRDAKDIELAHERTGASNAKRSSNPFVGNPAHAVTVKDL